MTISRFYIQINNNLTVLKTTFRSRNTILPLVVSYVKLMELIKTTQKSFKFLLTMCPANLVPIPVSAYIYAYCVTGTPLTTFMNCFYQFLKVKLHP